MKLCNVYPELRIVTSYVISTHWGLSKTLCDPFNPLVPTAHRMSTGVHNKLAGDTGINQTTPDCIAPRTLLQLRTSKQRGARNQPCSPGLLSRPPGTIPSPPSTPRPLVCLRERAKEMGRECCPVSSSGTTGLGRL